VRLNALKPNREKIMNPLSPSRETLKPIANHYYHDGAACVPLSPTVGIRNATILHKAMKEGSEKTIVRGDYNAFGKPFAYFTGKEKKFGAHKIETSNIRAERAEMANILSSIGAAAFKEFPNNFEVYRAALNLKLVANSVPISRDFKIGDLRKPLAVIAEAHSAAMNAKANLSPFIAEVHEKKVAKHRNTEPRSPELRDQRLHQFIKFLREDSDAFDLIIDHLGCHKSCGEEAGLTALRSMRRLIKNYLDLPSNKKIAYQSLSMRQEENTLNSSGKKSLTTFIKKNADDPDLQLFASLWMKMNKKSGKRGVMGIYSWANELTLISNLILGNTNDVDGGIPFSARKTSSSRLIFQRNFVGAPQWSQKSDSSLVMSSPIRPEPQSQKFERIVGTPEDESALAEVLSQNNERELPNSPYKGFPPSSLRHISEGLLYQSIVLDSLEEAPRNLQAIVTKPSDSLLPPASLAKLREAPLVSKNSGALLHFEQPASTAAWLTNVEKTSAIDRLASTQALPTDVKSMTSQED
jgi:hypothetical protein